MTTIISDGGGSAATLALAEDRRGVTRVVATDSSPGAVTYSIIGGEDQALFAIDATSGLLWLVNVPDFEASGDANHDNAYVVQVQAANGSSTAAQTITVNVTNVNDITGTPGPDLLVGTPTGEVLDGLGGADRILANAGNDTILINNPAGGVVSLLDFTPGVDTIGLDQIGFGIAGNGSLAANGINYVVGSAANTSAPTIIFNPANSFLSWDSDGTGPTAPVAFARYDPGSTVFWVDSNHVGPHPGGWLPAGNGDFNADGTADLAWFNAATGDLEIWKISNGQWAGSSDVGSHPAGYQPVLFGDYNHDGTNDVLWFNPTTGDVDLWKISNGHWAGSVDIGLHPTGWTAALTGDFNGDGTSDITWYNPATNAIEIWKISNGQWAGSVDVGSHPAGYLPVLAGDFNGDGTSDIAWYNPTTGDIDIWKMSNGQWAGSVDVGPHPAGWQPLGAADFNGDGTADIAWYNPATNNIDIWLIQNGQWFGSVNIGSHPGHAPGAAPLPGAGSAGVPGGGVLAPVPPPPGSVVAIGVGDFDHNGVADIMWRDTSPNAIEIWRLADRPAPVASDFNIEGNIVPNVSIPIDTDLAANNVAEGAANGTAVGLTASSTNPSGASVSYSLSDSAGGRFAINASTGVVSVANSSLIDFESASGHAYSITVQAASGALISSRTFSIGVSDVAPTVPTDANGATNSVAEGAANGTPVGLTVSSSDVNGGALTFSLTDNAGGRFAINASTGVVTVANGALLNFENATSHNITAQVSDGTLTSSQTFAIAVSDVAPSNPIDTNGSTGGVVTEGAPNGTAVGITVFSTDPNGPPPSYSLTNNAGGRFAIDSSTGIVTVANSALVDFETSGGSYTVTARATAGALSSATQDFVISVADVAPSTPIDTNGAANTVLENSANGTTVGITASSSDPNGPAPVFSLTDSAGGRFAINSSSGVVTVANGSLLDFETAHSHNITVRATVGALSSSQTFTINVGDVNDNAPVFTSSATPSVAENTTAVVNLTTTDADTVGTNPPTFTITGGANQGLFTITGGNQLAFIAPRDFETQAHSYAVQVTANDGANNTVQNLTVTLTDANDNAPVFTSSATPSVAENSTDVVLLSTTDADTVGTNPPTFSVTGGADGGLFTITGGNTLSFIAPRDFETQAHSYAVQVTANDGVNSTAQSLTVTLTDVNDNAPVFTSGTTGTEAENTATSNVVYTAHATDADASPAFNTVSYSLSSGGDNDAFNIDSTTGAVTFIVSPDFEAPTDAGGNNVYDIVVHANDGLHDVSRNVAISVTDLNDNAPIFTSGTTATAPENVSTSTAVYTALAPDADGTAANNTVTYSLAAGVNDNDLFNINSSTGAVTFKVSPDFESPTDAGGNNVYDIVVTASDGVPAHNATRSVAITVTDLNDNAPVFTSGSTGTEPENTATSNVVYDANATDADATPANNTITFSLSAGGDNDFFNINSSTGQVTFKVSPDFEAPGDAGADNVYDIVVHANDGVHDVTKNVPIFVTDLNDNAPIFTSGATASTAENVSTSTAVYTAQAPDADGTSANNTVTYSLAAGVNDNDLFNINSSTGAVTFKVSPNFEAPTDAGGNNVYDIVVTASDGLIAHNATKAVAITVTDLNDNAPIFSSGTTASTAENVSTATAVYTAVAPDSDGTPANNTVAYSLAAGVNDNDLFNINSSTGAVTFKTSPDFENPADAGGNNVYDIVVTASDGLPAHDATRSVAITVTDLNDNSPIFQSGTTGSEFENSPTSTIAYDADATDADGTPANNTITYSLSAGGDNNFFNINPTTGEVTFKVSPNFEAHADADANNIYDIVVHANDGAHDVTQNVAITVNDNNDPPTLTTTPANPIYTPGTGLFSGTSISTIESGQFIDQLVFTVSNVDDIDETMSIDGATVALVDNTDVGPTVAHGVSIHVGVDGTNTATVTISAAGGILASDMATIVDGMTYTDAAIPASGSRVVTITSLHDTGGNADGGNPTGTPNVTSTILFNQPPVIDAPANADTFATSINENTTAVTTIHATDPDTQPNPTVTYSIVSGFEDGALFSLTPNGSSADLAFVSAPNYENPLDTATDGSNTYIVKVRASDGASFDDQVITVTVNNVNEAPTANPDTASVQEKGGVNNGTAGNDVTVGDAFNVISGAGTGSAQDTDPDAGTTLTVSEVNGSAANVGVGINNPANYGTFTLNNNGGYTYIVNQTNASVQGLRTSLQTLTDQFTYKVTDGSLTSNLTTVTVTIHGQNDNPVANADTPTGVTEAGGTNNLTLGTDLTGFTSNVLTGNPAASGNVADTDVDATANGETMAVVGIIDGNHLGSVADGNVDGPALSANSPNDYGSITMHSDGGYNFAVNQSNAIVQALNVGQHVDAIFTYKIQDAAGATSTALLTIAVNGANDAPVAQADGTYVVNENTATTVNAATGVLANDSDVDNPSITAVQNAGPSHASSFTLNSDGSFSYTPAANYLGADSFTYHATDGSLSSAIVTVTLDVQPLIWHVDNSSVDPTEDGTAAHPFHSIANFNTANAAASHKPDIIYLHYGTGTYAETDGFNLANNQTLLGQGVDLTYTTSASAPGGPQVVTVQNTDNTLIPVIQASAGDGVDLAQNNTLKGFIVGDTSGFDISNTAAGSVGNLTISNVALNGTGGLINIDNGGTLNVQLDSATTANGSLVTKAIFLNNVDNSTFSVTGATTINDASQAGINIANSQNSTFTFTGKTTILNDLAGANGSGVDLQSNNAAGGPPNTDSTFNFNGGVDITVNGTDAYGFRAQSSGVVNILNPNSDNQITSNNGTAIFINPTQFQANLTNVTAGDGGTGDGIHLDGVSGSGVTIGSVSINGVAGDGIDINNSTAAITISGGSIGNTASPTGVGVLVTGGTGNVTVDATVNDTGASNAVVAVNNRTSGTVDFNGAITSTTNGVSLTGNTGGTVNFDGGMNLSTGSGAAFTVAGGSTGATLNVTGTNSLTTTTGQILSLSGVTIGASGAAFGALQSGTAVGTAVLLNDVDGSGHTLSTTGITIAGTTAGTGATTTSGAGNDGVRVSGGSAATFSFGGTTTIGTTGDDGIELSGANGAVTFSSVAITGSGGDGIETSGNTNAITISGGSIGTGNDPTGDGVRVAGGSADISVGASITKTTAGHVVDVSNHTGGTLGFSGAISATGAVDNGISLTTNGGSTINFSGGMTLTTGAGNAFAATGGATALNITNGANNHLTTTTGTALNISNSTIGASGVTFHDISANGGTNGIILNTTGTNAGLTVTGDGSTAGSGGTIQETTQGAVLTSTKNLSLSYMNFTNADHGNGTVNNVDTSGFNSAAQAAINMSSVTTATLDHLSVTGAGGAGGAQVGINGQNVSDLTLSNSTVSGFGDAAAEGDVKLWNLTGTSSVTNSNFSFQTGDASGGENLFEVRNNTSSSLTLTLTGNTFSNTRDSTSGSGGFAVTSTSSGTVNVNAYNNDFTNLKTSGFEGFAKQTSTLNINITDGGVVGNGNNFDPTGTFSGRAIGLNAQDTAHLNFNINRNTHILGNSGPVINVFGSDSSVINGRIDNNPDIENNKAGTAGSPIFIHPQEASTGVIDISNNAIINKGNDPGIFVSSVGDGISLFTAATDVTIANNTINMTGTNTFGILLNSGASNSDNTTVTANVHNNAVTVGGSGNTAFGIENTGGAGANVYLENFTTNGQTTWNNNANTPLNSYAELINVNEPAAIPAGHNGGHTKTPSNPNAMFAASGGVESASATPGEMNLTQAQLNVIVAAAIEQWAAAGASSEQIAKLEHATYEVGDAMGGWLGQSTPGHVLIDTNADRHGWFVDASPFDSAEFGNVVSNTRAFTSPDQAPAGHMDLLTVVMHEMGEQLGLDDQFDAQAQNDIMSAFLQDGERRLPGAADVTKAQQQDSIDAAQAAEDALPTGKAAAAGSLIVAGASGDDNINVSHPGTVIAGGAGADTFTFGAGVLGAPAASVTHIADYSALQGDIIDLSAIVSLPPMQVGGGGGQLIEAVRVAEDSSGAFATLQVDNAGHWTEVAQLDGVHAGDAVNVVVDQTQTQHQLHAAWLA